MSAAYDDFIASKQTHIEPSGFTAPELAPFLFPFQRRNVEWALSMGRAALFLDTGLGKTVQQLEWARRVADHTGRPTIVLAPLAVAHQTVREAATFGIDGVQYAQTEAGITADATVVVTNYERLDRFTAERFGGVVLDESGILKNYTGARKRAILEAFHDTHYKLACTATPAPNDHLELGNHAEFLGVMDSHQMIARWFINDTSQFGTYRLKGHAVQDFWDWVTSWAVLARLPSDLGDYDDTGYVLPELSMVSHTVDVDMVALDADTGTLFRHVEMNATQVHKEKRRTVEDRADKLASVLAADTSEPWIVWCDTNYEADALTARIAGTDVVELRGSDSDAKKEAALRGFTDGTIRVLITKPKIAGFGLNWQHCARVAFIGATYSFESWYQAVRRVWRFGQTRPVEVHMVRSSTASAVQAVMDRKRGEFESMQSEMVKAARRSVQAKASDRRHYNKRTMEVPTWM